MNSTISSWTVGFNFDDLVCNHGILENEPSIILCLHFSSRAHTYMYMYIHQVKGIVRQNINKVVERGERLDDLGDKAGVT